MELRAARGIRQDVELTIDRTALDPCFAAENRAQTLLKNWGIDCQCRTCNDPKNDHETCGCIEAADQGAMDLGQDGKITLPTGRNNAPQGPVSITGILTA